MHLEVHFFQTHAHWICFLSSYRCVCVCAYAITSKPVWSCMSKPIALVVDDSRLNGVKSPFTEQNQSLTSGEPIQSHWYVCFLSRGAVLVSKSCFKRSQTEKKKHMWLYKWCHLPTIVMFLSTQPPKSETRMADGCDATRWVCIIVYIKWTFHTHLMQNKKGLDMLRCADS